MSSKDTNMNYSRQSLRKATKFVEGDYSGINPRQFFRSLKRSLEEIQEADDFKYTTHGTQESDLRIKSEQVGEKTGRVKGRLVAMSDPREVGVGQLEYRPYGPHGAAGLVIGSLVFLLGLASEVSLSIVGLLTLIGGGYLYFQKETGEFPVERQDVIRTLMTGEVSERTIDDGDESHTDIFANMSVIYAGDALLNVTTEGLADMQWTLRRALTTQVNKWYNELVEDEDDMVEIQEGFMAELSSWSNRDLNSDKATIQRRQKTINNNFDMRIQYTEIMMDQLPNEMKDELTDHQDRILDELESLSENMDIYVEREGLEKVS
jgi:hypothetical protein